MVITNDRVMGAIGPLRFLLLGSSIKKENLQELFLAVCA